MAAIEKHAVILYFAKCGYICPHLAKYKMNIVGRKSEIALLRSLKEKPQSEFVAVYGRRRIGKTFLVREVYADELVFECAGLHQKKFSQQLENFWLALQEVYPEAKHIQQPKTWLQIFAHLKTYLNSLKTEGKKVVFLDELPWFETPRAGFLAALDNFWNQYCTKRRDIILVICGSAASWIIQKVVNDRGGLHNRITRHIRLMPFTLGETRDFLEMNHIRWSLRDIIQLYMCVGGVPFYLSDITPGQSVPQVLDALFFVKQARLINEFEKLYAALFQNSDVHQRVVQALASKNMGMTRNEIVHATDLQSGGGLTIVLDELIACGFVQQIFPVGKKKEDSLFRLIDEFTIFYYKFIQNTTGRNSWQLLSEKPSYKIWSGFAFENTCFKHIDQIKKALGINGIITNEFSWRFNGDTNTEGAQIDMLIDRTDNCMNFLEIKYTDAPYEMSSAYAEKMQKKIQVFRKKTQIRKTIFVTLLALNGVVKNEFYLSTVTNEVAVQDLFD
jgi:uncharacterized protein